MSFSLSYSYLLHLCVVSAGAISPKNALPAYGIAFGLVAAASYALKVSNIPAHHFHHPHLFFANRAFQHDVNEYNGCLSTLCTSLCVL